MKWISAKEELPAIGQRVILFANNVVQDETYFLYEENESDLINGYFWDNDFIEAAVPVLDDHFWMPLPSPPEE